VAVKDYFSKFYLIDYDNLPIPMTSMDVIPRMPNVKVALRIFGLLALAPCKTVVSPFFVLPALSLPSQPSTVLFIVTKNWDRYLLQGDR